MAHLTPCKHQLKPSPHHPYVTDGGCRSGRGAAAGMVEDDMKYACFASQRSMDANLQLPTVAAMLLREVDGEAIFTLRKVVVGHSSAVVIH